MIKFIMLSQIYMIIVMHTYMIQELAHQHKEVVPNNRNKRVIFKNYAPFINCIIQINKTQVDDAHDIGLLIPMYKLSEYSDIYSKTSGSLWQYYRDDQIYTTITLLLILKTK